MKLFKRLLLIVPVWMLLSTCTGVSLRARNYVTRNVVIIVIDGIRYSESWGDPAHTNIPARSGLMDQGVLVHRFLNSGITFTNPGHATILTGNHENIDNVGGQFPQHATFFQLWLKQTPNALPTDAYVITSKNKLHILRTSTDTEYADYTATINCGFNGDGTGGMCTDSITLLRALGIFAGNKPRLTMISFREPDTQGHAGNWDRYIAAIQKTDQYVLEVWNYLQSDPFYKDKTTLIVTNDHGRHLDGIYDGFPSHGDGCEGCRRIEFFAISPDFKKQYVSQHVYEQRDISATIAELLHIPFPSGKGRIMQDLLK